MPGLDGFLHVALRLAEILGLQFANYQPADLQQEDGDLGQRCKGVWRKNKEKKERETPAYEYGRRIVETK